MFRLGCIPFFLFQAVLEETKSWVESVSQLFRCAVASLYEVVSVRRSVGPSVCPVLFLKVKSTHTRRILCRVSGLVPRVILLVPDRSIKQVFSILSMRRLGPRCSMSLCLPSVWLADTPWCIITTSQRAVTRAPRSSSFPTLRRMPKPRRK